MTATEDAYGFEFTSIDGDRLAMKDWRGRPVLVVNTASYCGYTPQYSDLQVLWRRYRDRGLVVLGVPSNDFGAQEPGSAAEIKRFCAAGYAVDFPLTEKSRVIGGATLELSQISDRSRRPARRHLAGANHPDRRPDHRRNRAPAVARAVADLKSGTGWFDLPDGDGARSR
jgi:glutathione peroxidase-family protein